LLTTEFLLIRNNFLVGLFTFPEALGDRRSQGKLGQVHAQSLSELGGEL